MTFSYAGDPSITPKDTVRFLTGDTAEGVSLLSDEEIRYLLAQAPAPEVAAVAGVRAMLAKCAGDTLQSADGITRDLAERRQALQARLAELQHVRTFAATPFVGRSATASAPVFTQGQFEYTQSVSNST